MLGKLDLYQALRGHIAVQLAEERGRRKRGKNDEEKKRKEERRRKKRKTREGEVDTNI
jgi:hypothetical protein